jgi:Ribonuclease G/E
LSTDLAAGLGGIIVIDFIDMDERMNLENG